MLDWLVLIQFPEGGFQGGTIGAQRRCRSRSHRPDLDRLARGAAVSATVIESRCAARLIGLSADRSRRLLAKASDALCRASEKATTRT